MPERQKAAAAAEVIPAGEFSALLAELARTSAGSSGGWERWLRPGAVVGRFELVREIGRGGFGVVWEARDRQLGRSVAFKAVRPGDRVGSREDRLLREAEAAARLSHPNVVTLYEAGRCEQGPYLVLELLSGQTLADRIAQGPIPLREVVRIGVEVSRALAHAHAQGVVHRDLKPANVFLCENGRVKVLDFGLAHAFGTRRADGGTPAYMAPEQARGAPEDERTDVFAFGLLLHRMLAGALPFGADGRRAPAFTRAAPRLEVEEAPALGELISRMLAIDPVDRPRDGGEVLPTLTACQAELERTPSTGSGTVRTRRPRRVRAAALGAGLALAAAGAVAAWWIANRAPAPAAPGTAVSGDPPPVLVVADVENGTGDGDLDGLSRLLVLSLEQSRKLHVLSRSRIQGLSRWSGDAPLPRIDGDTAREAARREPARAVLLPALHRMGGSYVVEVRAEAPVGGATLFSARETTSSKEGIVPALDRISDRVRRELGEPAGDIEAARIQVGRLDGRSLEVYDLWLRASDVLSQYGEVGEARRLLLRAVEIDPDFALTRFALGDLALTTLEPEEAAPHLAAARRTLERLPDRERLLLELLLAVRDGAPGPDLDRRSRSLVDRYPNDKLLLLNAAQVHWRTLGDRPTAEALYRRGLALDPGLMCMAIDLVNLLGEEGRTVEAVSVARRAVAERPSAPNKTVLAMALAADGALAEAVEWARDAIRIAGGKSFYVTTFATEILARGDAPDEAEAEYRRVAATADYDGERRMATFGLVGLLAIQGRVAEANRIARNPGALPTLIRESPVAMSFLAGTGFPRLAAPRALEAVRATPTAPMTAPMLAFHGDHDGAAQAGKALEPESTGGTFLRALQAAAAGRTDDAVAAFRSLAHPARGSRRHQFLYLAGEALLEAGRPAETIEVLKPAAGTAMPLYGPLDVAANYPRAILVRARAYEKLGRTGEGLTETNRLLKQWARADASLPLVAEARALQARLAIAP